jgi:serine/threonine protein kinase
MKIEDRSVFNEVYLIMEYMEFDLRRLIESRMKITEQMIKFIMYQLLVAINFMHSADILHRDLKP